MEMAIYESETQEPSPDTSDRLDFLCEILPDEPMDTEPPIPVEYLCGDENDGAPPRDEEELAMIDSLVNALPFPDPVSLVDRPSWSSSHSTSLCSSSNLDSMPSTEYSLDLQATEPSAVGSGLVNLGNTCFMNAVLQCFTHTVPLMEGLRSLNHPMPCDRFVKGFCVVCTFRNHVQHSLSWPRASVSPRPFLDNLSFFSSSFRKFEQEDAHEFLQCFLDRLESCISFDENLVKKVFGGSLISKLECCNCGYFSKTPEPLIDLSLGIENEDSLTDALGSFTKMEKIEDSEPKYQCENCKEEVDVVKQLLVDEAPSVAVFHLKRFKAYGSYVDKIQKHVEFPLELDLQPFIVDGSDNSNVGLKYDLYGIVVHSGNSLTYGHYYSFIRSSSDTWHQLNDEMVTKVSQEVVLSANAYILFYARRGTPWFSDFMKDGKIFLDPECQTESPKSVLEACQVLPDTNASVSHEVAECLNKLQCINVDSCTVTPLGESNQPQEAEKVSATDEVFHPLTPPRPQTPGAFTFNSFESPGSSYQIPRDHLNSEERPSRKRLLNKSADDSEKKEAIRYLTKSMPSSRGSKLMEAIFGPQSEGAAKKKRRFGSPCKRASPTNGCHKSSHAPVTRPMAAVLR